MKTYQTYLLDLDGVVWRGTTLLHGAIEFVSWLVTSGKQFRYLSNNSMISPAEVAERLRGFGLPATDAHVVTASSAAVALLAERFPNGRVWVTGLPSLRSMVARAELTVLNLHNGDAVDEPHTTAKDADVVLVGLDRTLTYAGLQQATRALLNGAEFIAVNRDPQLPVEDGLDPGCGAILAALETASRRTATIVGKPSPLLLTEALNELHADPKTAVMVGDALEMDIAAGQAAGIDTILVLSGITSSLQAEHATPPPTWILRDLMDVLLATTS